MANNGCLLAPHPYRNLAMGLLLACGLAACGGGGDAGHDEPLNIDYSMLKIAESRETPLEYAKNPDEILRPLRNGARIMTGGAIVPTGAALPNASTVLSPRSDTTVQIEGVDEADYVKYDGRYLFVARPEYSPPTATTPQWSRNVLNIASTNPVTADIQRVGKYVIEGETNTPAQLYLLQAPAGFTEYLAAVSQDFRGWMTHQAPVAALVAQPDRTLIHLLDVRDPLNVSQAWKLELDGWLIASRKIGDTLYIVTSYRPRIGDLVLPADTVEKREANERRIRSASASDLLPGYHENDGARRLLVSADRCLVTPQLGGDEGYTDLVVISSINLRTRRVKDVNCLSTNVNGVFVSQNSLYVAGTGYRTSENLPITVLHKFAFANETITYRATGAVAGFVPWTNASYFMDERDGDLRILTTSNGPKHQLTVLRESAAHYLMMVSSLPNAEHPAPIGKPNESVYAVRFVNDRAYVVTFRLNDPLYVIDLHEPAHPVIAGELAIPGFSTYLRPSGAAPSDYLLSVGQDATPDGRRGGVKVELFDVHDIAQPRSLGAQVFGKSTTFSEGLNDPHALTFLPMPAPDAGLRLALPISVADTPDPTQAGQFTWTYSGLHLLEVTGLESGAPQLHFQGVIKTDAASDGANAAPYAWPNRTTLHADSVFGVSGDRLFSSRWQDLHSP